MQDLRDFDSLPDCALATANAVQRVLDISKPTLFRWIKSGRLPPPIRLAGSRAIRWRVGDIRELTRG